MRRVMWYVVYQLYLWYHIATTLLTTSSATSHSYYHVSSYWPPLQLLAPHSISAATRLHWADSVLAGLLRVFRAVYVTLVISGVSGDSRVLTTVESVYKSVLELMLLYPPSSIQVLYSIITMSIFALSHGLTVKSYLDSSKAIKMTYLFILTFRFNDVTQIDGISIFVYKLFTVKPEPAFTW